jgi:hypothetical protein
MRTITLRIRVHDEHQASFHLLTETNANPRICRTSIVDEDVVRVICDVDRELGFRSIQVEG